MFNFDKRAILIRNIARILYGVALVFVLFFVWKNAGQLEEHTGDLNWAYVGLAYLCTLSAHLLNMFVWLQLTRAMDITLPPMRTARAWFLSRFGRYIPGKIPYLMLRIAEYRGFPKKVVALAFAMEHLMSLLAACLLVLLGLSLSPEEVPAIVRFAAVAGAVVLVAFLYPPVLRTGANYLLRLVKREPIEKLPTIRVLLLLVISYTAVAAIHGLSFFFLLSSVEPVDFGLYPLITAVFYGAGLAGIAVLVAPAGLGVSESVLFLVLPLFVPSASVMIAALSIRVVMVSSEAILGGIFWLAVRHDDSLKAILQAESDK